MGTFVNLDAEMQKDLLDFVKKQEEKPWPKPLGDSLLADVFKAIIKGPCSVTGWARKGNKVWMELTWDFDEKKTEKGTKEDAE